MMTTSRGRSWWFVGAAVSSLVLGATACEQVFPRGDTPVATPARAALGGPGHGDRFNGAVPQTTPPPALSTPAEQGLTPALLAGRETFRFETFGDEAFWGDALGLHRAIEGQALGGVGAGLTPAQALSLGLKVDSEALTGDAVNALRGGKLDLNDPRTTLSLLRMNAVVGVKATMNPDGSVKTIGIQCALCHSTVDDSFTKGVGRRLDGWANRDLDIGAIVNLAPDVSPIATLLGVDQATVRKVLASWGPGKFDAQLILDGKAFQPDGKSAATLIPPAYGLAGVNLHTSTGWGSLPYWNAFVAVLEMHGTGNFFDSRLDDAARFPVAARNRLGHVRVKPEADRVSKKLPDLHAYQLSLLPPVPPAGSFDAAAAERGDALFNGKAKCGTCHVEPLGTDSGWNMHRPSELGLDEFQANRSPQQGYRTTPLRGLFAHQKGGFYHDGRFATLLDVVKHYDRAMNLGLTDAEQNDLVEYVKSL